MNPVWLNCEGKALIFFRNLALNALFSPFRRVQTFVHFHIFFCPAVEHSPWTAGCLLFSSFSYSLTACPLSSCKNFVSDAFDLKLISGTYFFNVSQYILPMPCHNCSPMWIFSIHFDLWREVNWGDEMITRVLLFLLEANSVGKPPYCGHS